MGRKFNRLEKKIEREYEKKGYNPTKAIHIANATAGKVFREQEFNKCHSCGSKSMVIKQGLLSKSHFCHKCGYKKTSY